MEYTLYFVCTLTTSVIFQANCIDSTAEAEAVFAGEVKKMRAEKMKPLEQVSPQNIRFVTQNVSFLPAALRRPL